MDLSDLIKIFLKDNKKFLLAYVLLMLAYPISSVYLPKYYGKLLEELKNEQPLQIKNVIILIVVSNIMFVALDKCDSIFMPKLQAYIRTNIVHTIIRAYEDKYQEQEIGKLMAKIVRLPLVIRDLTRQIRNYVIPICLILILTTFRFARIHTSLGVFFSGIFIGTFFAFIPALKRALYIAMKSDSDSDDVHELISELFDNILDIYGSNTVEDEIKNLEQIQTENIEAYQKTFTYTNTLRTAFNMVNLIWVVIMLAYVYKLYKSQIISLGDMVSVVVTCGYIMNELGGLVAEMPDFIYNLGIFLGANNYINSLDLGEYTETTQDDIKKYSNNTGTITFDNVTVKYEDKKPTVQNFNLDIKPGERIAFIGKIGSGKSTLVKAMLKLLKITEGKIYVNGYDIQDIQPSIVRSWIFYVPQNPAAFNRTFYENITYGNRNVDKQTVENMIREYGLSNFFTGINMDTMVGRKGSFFSGGQRMVMFLLRISLNNHKKIIVLDEPTSSLDSDTSEIILKLIQKMTKHKTVIIVSHDPSISSFVDKTIEIGCNNV